MLIMQSKSQVDYIETPCPLYPKKDKVHAHVDAKEVRVTKFTSVSVYVISLLTKQGNIFNPDVSQLISAVYL